MKLFKYFLSVLLIINTLFMACRDGEDDKGKITSLSFKEASRNLLVGEVVTINLTINPVGAKNSEKINYSVSQGGIINIKEGSSNEGVIVEALNRGSVVVMAKSSELTAYCNVVVGASDQVIVPYIVTPFNVIEVGVEEIKRFSVQIAGGTPADYSGFTWEYKGSKEIEFLSSMNVATITAKGLGEGMITARHPKAQYPVNILVFAVGTDENPVYITGSSNVININIEADRIDSNSGLNVKVPVFYQYQVDLVGIDSSYENQIIHYVEEGRNVIEVTFNGKNGSIKPLKEGIALISVSHALVKYPFNIQVFVNKDLEFKYIEVNKTFLLLEKTDTEIITADLVGDVPSDYINKFEYELTRNDIITVNNVQALFFINPIKEGSVVLKIKNEYADFEREVLIIITSGGQIIIDNEKYIITSQNVITMEMYGDDALLKMMLVGGNEADANNFTWWVEDSTVINLSTGHGKIEKNKLPQRSQINVKNETFEAEALITPLKVGTSKIVLENPKSKNTASVIVKVYPKNTFGVTPIVLGGSPVYRVKKGASLETRLSIESGSNNIGTLNWSCEHNNTASVTSNNLSGIIKGNSIGITSLLVDGENLKYPFRATIVVTDEGGNSDLKLLYTNNPFINMITGQNVMINIETENFNEEEMIDITVINRNPDIIQYFYSNKSLLVKGLKKGNAQVVINAKDSNELIINITVEDEEINLNNPYSLRSEHQIIGIAKNKSKDIEVNLVGGTQKDEAGIIWRSENSAVVSIIGNGSSAKITGLNLGQTKIIATHAKSVNKNYEIVIYVTENESDINNKIVISTDKYNYLIEKGEKIYIDIKTNANNAEQNRITWAVDNASIVTFLPSEDKLTAIVTGLEEGITKLTVSHPNNIIPQSIYISVVNKKQNMKYIGLPSIIESVVNNNLMISAVTSNLSDSELYGMKWEIDNKDIAVVIGQNGNCVIQPLKNGQAIIKVRLDEIDFEKKIILYVYSSYEEAANSYILGTEQSYYRIGVGDSIDVSLVFGLKGFPEHEINNIIWNVGNNNKISLKGYGKTVTVTGKEVGIAKIKAESNIAKNRQVEIEIEVSNTTVINDDYRLVLNSNDKIKGIVKGNSENVIVKLFRGNNEINTSLDKIVYTTDNEGIVSINKIDNNFRITAIKEGQTYINFSYPDVENVRILVYVANSVNELNNMFPIMLESNNLLLKKDEIKIIDIETINDDKDKLDKIDYIKTINNGSVSMEILNKKSIKITALTKGNEIIDIMYNGNIVQKLYVYVTETTQSDIVTYITTESLIGILKGETYRTKLHTNLNDHLSANIKWVTENYDIVGIEESYKNEAVLKGNDTGKTYINVNYGNIERKILVYVCENIYELNNFRAGNIDQRNYVIGKNQSLEIKLKLSTQNALGVTTYTDVLHDGSFANIINVDNSDNSKIKITGKNEGISAIRIQNDYYNIDIIVYIEVNEKTLGNIENISYTNYLTTVKTLHIIKQEDKDININVFVQTSGGTFNHNNYFTWSLNRPDIISLEEYGSNAIINPINKGEAIITVKHPYCDNELEITVIVGNRFEVDSSTEPYIYVSNVINDVMVTSAPFNVYYELRNLKDIHYEEIIIENNNIGVIEVRESMSGRLTITPKMTGMATVQVKYGNMKSIIYVMVRNGNIGDAVYLTTRENFIVTSVNELKSVEVSLVNYNETDSVKYKWYSENENIARVVGNGTRGQIYSLQEGETVIRVEHEKTSQGLPLRINLKVTKSTSEKAVYLTTVTNVIETIVDTVSHQIYVQKIGGIIDNSQGNYIWSVDRQDIISLTSSGLSATFVPKKAGIAKINVTNVEIPNRPLEIIIIVRNPSGSTMYITSDNSLIGLTTGSINNGINVNLAGGTEHDLTQFNWAIYHQIPTDIKVTQNNGNVITISNAGNLCYINAINDGIAKLRITHPKADNPYYITVQVSRFENIKFVRNEIEIVNGMSEFAGLEVPSYENVKGKVKFYSDNEDVVEVVGISNTALLQAKSVGFAVVRAWIEGKENDYTELYVTVVAEPDEDILRIATAKTSFVINPRDNPFRIDARVTGKGVNDTFNDEIEWRIVDDNSNTPISVFPKEKKGRELLITPVVEGEVTIELRHWAVEEKYSKTIHILITDSEDAFSIDKNLILITNKEQTTITANLIGAKSSDYNNVRWFISSHERWYDYSIKDVIRIGNPTGKTCMIIPVGEGEVIVTAMYDTGKYVRKAECKIIVEATHVFYIEQPTVKIYPGQVVRIPYTIKPTELPQWQADLDSLPMSERAFRYSGDPTTKELIIEGLREGSGMISALSSSNYLRIHVTVEYNYDFVVSPKYLSEEPINSLESQPMRIRFYAYPYNTRVEVEGIPDGLRYELDMPDSKTGYGWLTVWNVLEFDKMIKFIQYTAGTEKEKKNEINVQLVSKYKLQIAPIPYFERNHGNWSNIEYNNGLPVRKKPYLSWENKVLYGEELYKNSGEEYEIELGDGEQHYILFDKRYDNQVLNLTGNIDTNNITFKTSIDEVSRNHIKNNMVKIEKIVRNGIEQYAIRLNGLEDYIEYDRVMFDKYLFFQIEASSDDILPLATNGILIESTKNLNIGDYIEVPIEEEEESVHYEELHFKRDMFVYDINNWFIYNLSDVMIAIGIELFINKSIEEMEQIWKEYGFMLFENRPGVKENNINNIYMQSDSYNILSHVSNFVYINNVGVSNRGYIPVHFKSEGYCYTKEIVEENKELFEGIELVLNVLNPNEDELWARFPLYEPVYREHIFYDTKPRVYFIYPIELENTKDDKNFIFKRNAIIYDDGSYDLKNIKENEYKFFVDMFGDNFFNDCIIVESKNTPHIPLSAKITKRLNPGGNISAYPILGEKKINDGTAWSQNFSIEGVGNRTIGGKNYKFIEYSGLIDVKATFSKWNLSFRPFSIFCNSISKSTTNNRVYIGYNGNNAGVINSGCNSAEHCYVNIITYYKYLKLDATMNDVLNSNYILPSPDNNSDGILKENFILHGNWSVSKKQGECCNLFCSTHHSNSWSGIVDTDYFISNRIVAEDNYMGRQNDNYIIPLNRVFEFPLDQNALSYYDNNNKLFVKNSDNFTTTPMPSINTTSKDIIFTVYVEFSTFDGVKRKLPINITYKIRPSHCLYEGQGNDYNHDPLNYKEYQGLDNFDDFKQDVGKTKEWYLINNNGNFKYVKSHPLVPLPNNIDQIALD